MMKRWISLTGLSLAILALVFCSNKPFSGDEPLLKRLMITLNGQHYAPKSIDDAFSLLAFENALENLDGGKQFYTQEDITKLQSFEKQIDDQINAGRFDFFDSAWNTLMQRLDQIEPWILEPLKTPLDYKAEGSFEVSQENKNFPADDAALKDYWTRWTRYQVVDRLYRKQKQQDDLKKGKDSAGIIKIVPFDTLELKARNETKTFVENWFKRWRKMDRQDKVAFYANTIAEIYDPHTNYFPPADKENFDISMTGKLEGIGATLTERDGYVKVERIVPGSASYKQGELKAGYLILKVAQGEEEPVDIVDMKLDDAIQLIRGKKGTEVRLTVKKPDGVIKVIPIIREVVVIEETYARSALISYKGKRFGIIQLPSFYADFSSRGRGRNSAGDVRLEIEKLQEEKVNGIILDLRNNGGGSLADAIEMSGLFIASGPIVQVKDSEGNINAANDFNPTTLYDGPLVVLTNAYSASASEILAAALQDYKRAIILGSKSTFGKGTVQTMVALNGGRTDVFPRGFGELKVTIQKFYRINGGTTQLKGVEPDVVVPDIYDGVERGEKEMNYHLAYDQIPSARYKSYESKAYREAIKSGQKWVSSNKYFDLVAERSGQIEKIRKGMNYSLNLDAYAVQQESLEKNDEKFRKYEYKRSYDTVFALKRDLQEVQNDSIKRIQRANWPKPYLKDATLDAALEILQCWSGK
jgi:carboxyl-terminal processing protease